jgi:hypothetical protein
LKEERQHLIRLPVLRTKPSPPGSEWKAWDWTERVVYFGPIWLPVFSMQLAVTRIEGCFKPVPQVTHAWNAYDALHGNCIGRQAALPTFSKVSLADAYVSPLVKAAQIERGLQTAPSNWSRVKTDDARKRHSAVLASLGLQTPMHSLAVESTDLVFHPLWIALVIEGVSGKMRDDRRLPHEQHSQSSRCSWWLTSTHPTH